MEALVLGLRDMASGDRSQAARSAPAKIKARVPPRQAHRLQRAVLDAHRCASLPAIEIDVAA